ncbi:type I 3-dehydroquinate dehydratase [Lachnospiraceae bacterium ASD3451]|uniref:type I 3-dehydroquinate dehydratase n=1 Tax=Diplocloster agilis TaxID=2850323 RepID=UPI001E1127A2|nr:type I 3-dehydroquinate dehydratase [Diplocloster agilis]MBU9742291.1 type I 3-dehydroquinate dehydratase [Diplocloster agilis]
MNPVIVRNIKIGEGRPKICVPLVGATEKEILDQAAELSGLPADIVEWRADWFEEVFDFERVNQVLVKLREAAGGLPLLFTFRTAPEGGEKPISGDAYTELLIRSVQRGLIDLVDIEYFTVGEDMQKCLDAAHEAGVKVIASSHDFGGTPSKEEMVARLRKMQETGADISKLAVMPRSTKDVLALLDATQEMVSGYADRPVITMSMGGIGLISRLCGEEFGSSVTFGAAKRVSAPGQIPVTELESILKTIHENMQ